MATRGSKRLCVQDALHLLFDGNESEIEESSKYYRIYYKWVTGIQSKMVGTIKGRNRWTGVLNSDTL